MVKKGMIFQIAAKYRYPDTPLYFKVVATKIYKHSPPGAKSFNGLCVSFVCSNDIHNFPPDEIATNLKLRNQYPDFSFCREEIFRSSSWIKVDMRKHRKTKSSK